VIEIENVLYHAERGVVQHAFDFDHVSAEESLPSNRKAKRVW